MTEPMRGSSSRSASVHRPVLVHEVIQYLDLRPDHVVIDGTVGAGGHSRVLLDRLGPSGKLIGLDRDPMMLQWAAKNLADPRCTLKQASYAQLPEILDDLGIDKVDRVLLDLGLASDHLADTSRGFSFQAGGPLDMRFDSSNGVPASQLLATLDESELASLLFKYGEERHSRAIARAIVKRRGEQPLQTVADLLDVVSKSIPGGSRRHFETHPATRVFQALRIAVNHELDHLTQALTTALPDRLQAGGRAVIITFHSLEDRLVKDAFREDQTWQNLTPKPITARPAEVRMNPRCRTAKLRAAVRKEAEINPPIGGSPKQKSTRPSGSAMRFS
jgi:16S rRNA (cytosine1402-N4)-methyltransferase